jgi:hypothetical protein
MIITPERINPQFVVDIPMRLAIPIGSVESELSFISNSAKKYSFHDKAMTKMTVATIPGSDSGRIMSFIIVIRPAPTNWADSTTEGEISLKNTLSNISANGSAKAV